MHGVEIGGVHEGQPRGYGLGEDAAADLGQGVIGEGLAILGVHNQYRSARRRAQDPGLGDLGAQDGVDQRRLARTSGPAHDDDGGQVGIGQARQHVITDLADETGPQPAGLDDTARVQRELEPLQVPHGVSQDIDKLGATERRDRNILPGGE